MTTLQADIIIRESPTQKQLIGHSHNILDNYFRLISSFSGKILASITNLRQLTIFDLKNQSSINNFTLENVIYCAFNQNSSILAVTTHTPSIRLYKIAQTPNSTTNSTTISLIQLQQIRPLMSTTTYGWIVSTLDNEYFYFTQNQQIFAVDCVTFEIRVVSVDPLIRRKCAPYYLIIDREYKRLVSSSRVGHVCTYEMTLRDSMVDRQQSQLEYWPHITLQQSSTLSSSNNSTLTVVSDINQSDKFILISTSKVTDFNSSYYNTYIIPKANFSVLYKIKLQQELLAPPYTIVADNVENYLLAFLKGEKSLYVYDLGLLDQQSNLILVNNNSTVNQTTNTLPYISMLQMPFLMQGISYNMADEILMMGISSIKNENKIIHVDFGFNCSNITLQYGVQQQQNVTVASSNDQGQIKSMCTQECEEVMSDSVFSFSERSCVVRGGSQVGEIQDCKRLGQSYLWDIYGLQCELQCANITNSLSEVPFGQPQQCYCQHPYTWNPQTSSCQPFTPTNPIINNQQSNFTTIIKQNITTIINNSTDNNNTDNSSFYDNNQPRQVQQSSRVGVVVGVTLGVVVIVVVLGLVVCNVF